MCIQCDISKKAGHNFCLKCGKKLKNDTIKAISFQNVDLKKKVLI